MEKDIGIREACESPILILLFGGRHIRLRDRVCDRTARGVRDAREGQLSHREVVLEKQLVWRSDPKLDFYSNFSLDFHV